MNLIESKRCSEPTQFFDKPLDAPKRDVGRLVSSPGSELVVEDHGAFVSKCSKRVQVVAGRAGPSVQQYQWSAGSVTNNAIPNTAARDIYIAFSRLEACSTTCP